MILLYHLVFPDATPSDTWNAGKVLRLSGFKKQVSWLKKYYHIISVNEYLSNQTESRNKIALTFDDGYHQTIDLVVPFLQDQGIPATFFLNTSNLDDDKLDDQNKDEQPNELIRSMRQERSSQALLVTFDCQQIPTGIKRSFQTLINFQK